MRVKYYQKKPVTIQAMQLLENNFIEVARWCGVETIHVPTDASKPIYIEIETLEGAMRAEPSDWIIRGIAGEFYPCKDDIFKESYNEIQHKTH